MDSKERLFADVALRLQLLTQEQVAACGERAAGKPLPAAAVELGFISADEAALVSLQAERALARQQQQRAGAAGVRVAEERVQRSDPRAEPARQREPAAVPRAAAPQPPGAAKSPPAEAQAAAGKARKRGARAWESEAVAQGQIRVPRMADGSAAAPDAAPAVSAIADTALWLGPNDANQDLDGFPLAAGDEVAQVALSESPPPRSPAAAAHAPAPPRSPAPPPAAQVPPPPPSSASATMQQVHVPGAPPRAASSASNARIAPVAALAGSGAAAHASAAVSAREVAPAPEPVRGPVRTPPPPRAAEQRPAAALAPQQTYLGKALALAMRQRASDLHVHSGAPLLVRIDGQLRPISNAAPIAAEAAEKIIAEITTDTQWAQLSRKGEVDFACELPGIGRFRANVYRQQRGLDAVFRLIPLRPPSLEELGLPARLARLTDFRTGMVLCTGPAGCGKSTTLAALVNTLVQTRADHILTIEDPVEYVFGNGRALVNQRQLGDHTSSFARALRAALREDPDIIAITELRDRETISLAISAAETGHLVLGTLHTGNAAQTIHRMVSSFPADEQEQIRVMLAESLRAVVSQRLVPTAQGRGRVPAIELLMVTTAVSNLIRDDKTHQLPSVMQTGKAAGMLTLDDSLEELVTSGTITADAARRVAVKKERFA